MGGKFHSTIIKFLIRYEVSTDENNSNNSRFRFQRMIVYIDSYQTFNVRYRINMSSVQPGTHLVNLTMAKSVPKGLPDDQYEVPKI